MKSSVVLLSGGIDSAVCAWMAKDMGFALHGMTVDYGQRHAIEIEAAKGIAETLGFASHIVVHAPINKFCHVPLLGFGSIPENRSVTDVVGSVSPMYVPARNSIFLSYALALAETRGADSIFIGATRSDAQAFPDCRPEFFRAWETLARLGTTTCATGKPISVRTPLIDLTKREVIGKAVKYGIDLDKTISCYDPQPDGTPCDKCDACILRNDALSGDESTTR